MLYNTFDILIEYIKSPGIRSMLRSTQRKLENFFEVICPDNSRVVPGYMVELKL